MNGPDPTYPIRTYENSSGGPNTNIGNSAASKCFKEIKFDLAVD
jgi:hypothetical protein